MSRTFLGENTDLTYLQNLVCCTKGRTEINYMNVMRRISGPKTEA